MSEPRGLTLDDAGNLFVADSNYYRIQEFSASGTFYSKGGSLATAKVHLTNLLM